MLVGLLILALTGQAEAGASFSYPEIDLDGRLRDIFVVSECKYVSGLSCRIQYNGKAPLPGEVFFTEFDGKGHRLGRRTRLIYPELKKGASGVATFRLRSNSPARIRLEATGKGPWKNPY
jgi:hypothetical protein